MRRLTLLVVIPFSISMLVITGCTKPYAITTELEKPLSASSLCIIEDMKDELPVDFPEEKKPTQEVLNKFNNYLIEELEKTELFGSVAYSFPSGVKYKVSGSILEYKAGSGFLRFMFGAMAGSAKVVVSLKLQEIESGDIIYAGNFYGTVTHWAETGDKVYRQVAKNFANTIKKKQQKLLKDKS